MLLDWRSWPGSRGAERGRWAEPPGSLLGLGEVAGGDQGSDGPQRYRQGGEGEALALPDLAEGLRGHAHRRLVMGRPGGQPFLRRPRRSADPEHVLGERGMRG